MDKTSVCESICFISFSGKFVHWYSLHLVRITHTRCLPSTNAESLSPLADLEGYSGHGHPSRSGLSVGLAPAGKKRILHKLVGGHWTVYRIYPANIHVGLLNLLSGVKMVKIAQAAGVPLYSWDARPLAGLRGR